jgi:hypothetical protein
MSRRDRTTRDRRPDAADAIVAAIMKRPGMREAVRADHQRNRARIAASALRYPNDPPGYAERVRELETEGLCTSDAQGAADVEFGLVRHEI